MKNFSRIFSRQALLVIAALCTLHATAQTFPVPVVTMHAPDPYASESGDTATFEVDRTGSAISALNIYYEILGTASNGVDYAAISHFVTIPAGVRKASISIKPLEN